MKKIHIFSKVSRKDLVDLDELFDEDNWRDKAHQLQLRRWREVQRRGL